MGWYGARTGAAAMTGVYRCARIAGEQVVVLNEIQAGGERTENQNEMSTFKNQGDDSHE
jgi:uncharacterized protein YpuA (DUF1002 family)